jgi:hypothetical protein
MGITNRIGQRLAVLLGSTCARLAGRLLTALAPLALAGCMDMETVVHVDEDGSGTITERLVMSNEIVAMIAEMTPEGQPVWLYNEEELRAKAANYGHGVRFFSAEPVKTDFGQGYVVRYDFADINRIRVGQEPSETMPGSNGTIIDDGGVDFATFSMEPGNPAQLIIHWPVDHHESRSTDLADMSEGQDQTVEPSPEQQAAAMEMMKAAFKDMHLSLKVEVAGQIVETNATHLDGSRVTLVDISFADFLNSEEALREMALGESKTIADIKDLTSLIPGLKLEIEPEVSVLFE